VPRIAGLDFGHGFHKVEIQPESIRGAFVAPNDLREVMSALGQKQTYAPQQAMSAIPPIATLLATAN
jgi:hypothetical protein